MKKNKINYLHLCEYVSINQNNTPNIMGIFNDLNTDGKIPYVHPQMYLVANVSFENVGDHRAVLTLVDPDLKPVKEDKIITVNTSREFEEVGYMLNLIDTNFQTEGKYTFKLTLDDETSGEICLNIRNI